MPPKQNKKLIDEKPNNLDSKFLTVFKNLLIILLIVVLFYPPFIKGLFFLPDQLFTQAVILGIFILFWVYKILSRDGRFFKTPLDYILLCLNIIYGLSIILAVNKNGAIVEWIKYCMYFAVFFMITELINTYKLKLLVLWTIMLSGAGMCLLSIDAVAGEKLTKIINKLFESIGFRFQFVEAVLAGRIDSPMQSPNGFASYILAIFLISLVVIMISKKTYIKMLTAPLSFIYFLMFIFTQSRAAYIVAVVIFALFFIILKSKEKRIMFSSFLISAMTVTAIISIKFSAYISNPSGNIKNVWLLVLTGVIVQAVLVIFIDKIQPYLVRINTKFYIVFACVLIVAFLSVTLYAFNAKEPVELTNNTKDKVNPNITKLVPVDANKNYKLILETDIQPDPDNMKPLNITLESYTKEDLIKGKSNTILSEDLISSQGREKKEIPFKTLENTEILSIKIINKSNLQKTTLYSIKLANGISGKVVNNIPIKFKFALVNKIYTLFENTSINQDTTSRLYFYKDGLKMFLNRPLGSGGGAWNSLLYMYQSYPYSTVDPHNYLILVGIEAGILGILVLLIIFFVLIGLFFTVNINKTENSNEHILHAGLLCAIIGMFLHSFADFDFASSAIYLLVWQLMGLFNSEYIKNYADDEKVITNKLMQRVSRLFEPMKKIKKISVTPIIPLLVTILIFGIPFSFYLADKFYYKGTWETSFETNKNTAMSYVKKSAQFNPFEPSYKLKYASMLLSNKYTEEELTEAIKYSKSAEKYCWFNYEQALVLSKIYLEHSKLTEGLKFLNRSVDLRPNRADMWANKISVYDQLLLYTKNESAILFAKEMLSFVDKAKTVNKRNIKPFIFNDKSMDALERTYLLKFNNFKGGIDLSKEVMFGVNEMDINFDGIPDQWQSTDTGVINFKIDKGTLEVKNLKPVKEEVLSSRDLFLTPGKNYRIELLLAEDPGQEEFHYSIFQAAPNGILKRQNGNLYVSRFSTDPLFVKSTNRIYIGIKNKLVIKNFLITEE